MLTADHPDVVLRGALQTGAHDGPHGAQRDGPRPADLVADPPAEQAPEQRAEVVDGHDAALEQRVRRHDLARVVDVAEAHERHVVVRRVHAAHHALVVAEEEDAQRGDAVDGDEQAALLEVVGHVEARQAL